LTIPHLAARGRAGHGAYDVVVVGGGPAGLSAALYLGRSRRRTLVLDTGVPRNRRARAAHGVFTRDGATPASLLEAARQQLVPYPSVSFCRAEAASAEAGPDGIGVRLDDGTDVRARRLLLACGVRDDLPPIDGLAENWGTGVLHCAYCHGHEVAGQPLALHANGAKALAAVRLLTTFSRDLLLCTDGAPEISEDDRQRLAGLGVRIVEAKLFRVEKASPHLALHFADGRVVMRHAIFLSPAARIASPIPSRLGCEHRSPGRLAVGADWATTVPGVYAAGDIAAASGQIVIAAASGAEAAMALNGDLAREDVAR
jgi:thioredoxin reductase